MLGLKRWLTSDICSRPTTNKDRVQWCQQKTGRCACLEPGPTQPSEDQSALALLCLRPRFTTKPLTYKHYLSNLQNMDFFSCFYQCFLSCNAMLCNVMYVFVMFYDLCLMSYCVLLYGSTRFHLYVMKVQ